MNLLKKALKPNTEASRKINSIHIAREYMCKIEDAFRTIKELQALIDGPQIEHQNYKTTKAVSSGNNGFCIEVILDLQGNPLSAKYHENAEDAFK
jgi:hypothetical protein